MVEEHLAGKTHAIVELFEALRERIFALSTDETITEKANKMYIGYKHGKNFAEIQVQARGLRVWLDISSSDLDDPYHITRDVRNIGHHGTGSVEIRLNDLQDLDKAMALIEQSYQQTV